MAGWCAPYCTESAGLRYGAVFGLAAGIVFLLYIAIDTFSNPDGAFDALLGNSTMIAVCLLCFIAGLLTTHAIHNIVTGLLAGMCTGMIAMHVRGIGLAAITALFTGTIIHSALFFQDYLKSGVSSTTAFTILDNLNGFCLGLILPPLCGSFLGAIGGVSVRSLARQQAQS